MEDLIGGVFLNTKNDAEQYNVDNKDEDREKRRWNQVEDELQKIIFGKKISKERTDESKEHS